MDYRQFARVRSEARVAFDEIEEWMANVFGDDRDEFLAELDDGEDDLDLLVAQRRRGMRYLAAGRVRDRRLFASILFPLFHGDPHESSYREAIEDILRVAGASVQAKTRHKLNFELGIVYFTGDDRGNLFGIVASDDFPMT